MTVELRPLGVNCNLQCQYCYQHPQRDAGNVSKRYDMERMKAGILAEGGPFNLFGGEALLVPKDDLEELWSWGLETFGRNTIQTNATLIDEDHISMFHRYKVTVGVSMDGPGELNDTRWFGTVERTRAATERSQAALERLCDEGLRPSMILTLHAGNARPEALPRLITWVERLVTRGLASLRLHLLESETEAVLAVYGLSAEENIAAMRAFLELSRRLPRLRMLPFADMRKMLIAEDERTTCIWNGCDPYNTKAVQGVEGDGQRSNCGRTNKDGIDFEKSAGRGMERALALYHTPQPAGGCKDCQFFLMCKGQCPGTAIDRDWRNRSEHCAVWKALYADLEQEWLAAGRMPLSRSPRRAALESQLTRAWEQGRELRMARVEFRGTPDSDAQAPGGGLERPAGGAIADSLDFVLPAFTRVSWVSAPVREVWEPRIRRVRAAWEQVEWRSVEAGLRACAQLGHSSRSLDPGRAIGRGLRIRVLDGWTLLARAEQLDALCDAIDACDHDAVGALLGYPPCCRSSFVRFCGEEGLTDLTWPAALHSAAVPAAARRPAQQPAPEQVETHIRAVGGVTDANLLWSRLGVRSVPHIPCSFECDPTRTLGTAMRNLMRELGFVEESGWLEAILEWPVEWSALHGIAETKTPILKIASQTHATANKYVVRRAGSGYPEEGARGVRFPYRRGRARLTGSAAFERGLTHALRVRSTAAGSANELDASPR